MLAEKLEESGVLDSAKAGLRYTLSLCQSLPKFDRSVSWLCWAYNEEELIGDYLVRANELLQKTAQDYEIIVVDDGSIDHTAEIITRLQKEIPQIRLIQNPTNMDVGIACRRAIMSARKEYLFWQTVDWAYDFTFLRLFLELTKSYDVVAGIRKRRDFVRRSDTLSKAFVSMVNYWLIRFLFRLPLGDYQNVVFYPTPLIQSIAYESKSSFVNPEGLIKTYWRGSSIVEVPIPFMPRKKGKAKGTRLKSILSSVRDVFGLWFRWTFLGQRGSIQKGEIRRLREDEWESRC